jgi:hypothetical protein
MARVSTFSRGLVVLAAVALAPPKRACAQTRFGVDVFGLSYHYQSRAYQVAPGVARRYEQLNLGLGVEYVVRDDQRVLVSTDGGIYRDSKDRGNGFAGVAVRFRVAPHLLLGGSIVGMTSRTYGTHVAPLPLVTAQWRHVSVSTTLIPALSSRESGAIGLFTTVYW